MSIHKVTQLTKTSHREEADAKKAEANRKKAERDAQLAEENAASAAKPKGATKNQKPSRGTLDLSQLDAPAGGKASALNATGIDNALDALSLTATDNSKVDRHPERRYRAAYAAYEERRMPEIEKERPGLRKNQRVDIIRKEFNKSDENPFNQAHVRFDASREEVAQVKGEERRKAESRLTT